MHHSGPVASPMTQISRRQLCSTFTSSMEVRYTSPPPPYPVLTRGYRSNTYKSQFYQRYHFEAAHSSTCTSNSIPQSHKPFSGPYLDPPTAPPTMTIQICTFHVAKCWLLPWRRQDGSLRGLVHADSVQGLDHGVHHLVPRARLSL